MLPGKNQNFFNACPERHLMTSYLKYPVNFLLPQLKEEEGFVYVHPFFSYKQLPTSVFQVPFSRRFTQIKTAPDLSGPLMGSATFNNKP